MGRGSVSSKFLVILNVLYSILGAAIIGLSIWFFINLTSLTSLRNENHFKLDTNIYWVQALPWIFIVAGVFVIMVSGCAFLGVMKKSRPLVLTNAAFQILTILLLVSAATVSIKYADSEDSDRFVKVTLSDAFQYLQMANDPQVDKAFQEMEVRLQCCGSSGPTSYNEFETRWKHEYPASCCKSYTDEPDKTCSKVNAVANTRKGCIDIAIHHVRIAVKIFAGAGIFTAFIGVLNCVTALLLTNGLSNRKKMKKATMESSETLSTHKSHMSNAEMETLKMPLKV